MVKDFISLSGNVDESIACNQESFLSSLLDGTVSGLITGRVTESMITVRYTWDCFERMKTDQ